MELPQKVRMLLQTLQDSGYEGYAVGGCVRDTLLGRTPHDWDICTSALPHQVQQCFAGYRMVETGLAHGTVTVVLDHEPYEITTFRVDGEYTDHRRPKEVQFVRSLREDLARRDFTVNAMACGLDGQLQDPFGGQEDLQKRIIRCVGEPSLRFEEDALRILRALRFAATLGFDIDPATLAAAREKQTLLDSIAAERVFEELDKLVCGDYAGPVLRQCGDVLAQIIPEIGPCIGFDQKNPCHDRDVWTHTADALAAMPGEQRVLRWALLLHDLAKPRCFTIEADGLGHAYGHPALGEKMAHQIFRRLKSEKKLEDEVCQLIFYHDSILEGTRKAALRWLNRLGREQLGRLIRMKQCDILAHADIPVMRERAREVAEFAQQVQNVLRDGACTCLAELAVTGKDLIRLGIPAGVLVGRSLHTLLEKVLDEELPNERGALLAYAARWRKPAHR